MSASCATVHRMEKANLTSVLKRHGVDRGHLAALAGVNKSSVTRWLQGRLTAERAVEIERLTGIPRSELRPDIFGEPEAAQ